MDPTSSDSTKKRNGLRLIVNNSGTPKAEEEQPKPQFKSRFAQQLAAFAEQLDKDIEEVMKL